jgi:eukaryotic-like serine/threonine-protein kinase
MVQTMDTQHIAPGQLLGGKYRIERLLGEGGMGVVVAARHLELDEPVAIKFLLPEALANTEAVGRFAREARAAVKIKSQHVARTIDVGKLDNGAPYIVMEYLDGMDLSARLRKFGPLSVDDAVSFALQTCEALADAHALGIIHRDLKPAHLFVVHATDNGNSRWRLEHWIHRWPVCHVPG